MSEINWERFAADAADQALNTLLWSSFDDDGESLDDCEDEVSEQLKSEILADTEDYLSIDEVQRSIHQLNLLPAEVGHNFYLSANGHGTGFWDRGYGTWGDRLHAWSKGYQRDIYRGDDGMIY